MSRFRCCGCLKCYKGKEEVDKYNLDLIDREKKVEDNNQKQQSKITWQNNNQFLENIVNKNQNIILNNNPDNILNKKQEQQLKTTGQNKNQDKNKNSFAVDNFEIISLKDEIEDEFLKKFVEKNFDDETKSSLNCIISKSEDEKNCFYLFLKDFSLREIYTCLTEHNTNMESLIKKIPFSIDSPQLGKTMSMNLIAGEHVVDSLENERCFHFNPGDFCEINNGALFRTVYPFYSNKKYEPIQITDAIDWNGKFTKAFKDFYKKKHIEVLENPDKNGDFLIKNNDTKNCLFRIDSEIKDDIVLEGKKKHNLILKDKNIDRDSDEYAVFEQSNYCLAINSNNKDRFIFLPGYTFKDIYQHIKAETSFQEWFKKRAFFCSLGNSSFILESCIGINNGYTFDKNNRLYEVRNNKVDANTGGPFRRLILYNMNGLDDLFEKFWEKENGNLNSLEEGNEDGLEMKLINNSQIKNKKNINVNIS